MKKNSVVTETELSQKLVFHYIKKYFVSVDNE